MKTVNKILILLLCSSMAIYVGYSLTKGTRSAGSELSFNDFEALMDDVDYTISVDTKYKLVEYLEAGTSVSKLLEKMPIEFIVCDKERVKKDDSAPIASGDILSVDGGTNSDGKTVCKDYGGDTYRLSVLGDVNGDGDLDLLDVADSFDYYRGRKGEFNTENNHFVKAGDAVLDKSGYISFNKDNLLMIMDDKESFDYVIHPGKNIELDLLDVNKLFEAIRKKTKTLEHNIKDDNVTISFSDNIVNVEEGEVTSVGEGETNVVVTTSANVTNELPVSVANIKSAYDYIYKYDTLNSTFLENDEDYITNTDRWSSAVIAADHMYPNGSTSVVLVEASGYDIDNDGECTTGEYNDKKYPDGYVATSLAAALDAPILFVDGDINDIAGACGSAKSEDEIIAVVQRAIKVLKPSKIYIVGGTEVITDDAVKAVIPDSVSNVMLNEDGSFTDAVTRITGADRIDTSVAVAQTVFGLNEVVDSVIIADADLTKNENTDAALVSFVSANDNKPIPILYVDPTQELSKGDNQVVYKFLNGIVDNGNLSYKDKIKSVYLVGGDVANLKDDIEEIDKKDDNIKYTVVESIYGSDRYKTNAEIIKYFNKDFKNIILVDAFVDMIYASRFAAKKNAVIVNLEEDDDYLDDALEEVIIENLKDVNNSKKIYWTGHLWGNKITSMINLINKINRLNFGFAKKNFTYLKDFLFNGEKAVFYMPQQGSATLYASQLILAAIEELGVDNVYVVLLTDGRNSGAKEDPDIINRLKSYNNNLDVYDDDGEFTADFIKVFIDARDREMIASLEKLGVKNIDFVEKLGARNAYDYKIVITTRFEDGKLVQSDFDAIRNYYTNNDYSKNVSHFVFSSVYSSHVDYKTLGSAFAFNDIYYIAINEENVSEDDKVPEEYFFTWDDNNSLNNRKIVNACYQFDVDEKKKLAGIGFASSGNLFEEVITAAKGATLKTRMHVGGY